MGICYSRREDMYNDISDIDDISDSVALQYALECGIIDLQHLREELYMKQKQRYLAMHTYSIWEGKDGKCYTYLPDKVKGRKKIKKNTKEEIEKVVVDYWKQQAENPTIEDVFNEWNERRLALKKIVPSTYSRNQRVFARHYKDIKHRKIKGISFDDMVDFLEEQVPKHDLTAKAFSNLKTITRGFFKRAKKQGFVDYNIEDVFNEMDLSEREFRKNIKEDYEEVFSEDEFPVIEKYLCENLDLRNLGILLMFLTGIRVGELVSLKHEDFDGIAFRIRRTETKYHDEETDKDVYEVKDFPKTAAGLRTVVIPPDYAWIVKKLKTQNPFGEYIFCENGKRLTTNCIRQRMYRVCRHLNIYPKSPHKARKTYGSILLDNNIDNRFIIDQMGHTDVLCSEKHYHRNRRNIDRKSQILGSISEFQAK